MTDNKDEKLNVSEVLYAIDLNLKGLWDDLSDQEKKSVNFWLLNRYVSSVNGSYEEIATALLKTNEYYNKDWAVLGTKHPKLQWLLLCVSGPHKSETWNSPPRYHEWIGLKYGKKGDTKIISFLSEVYPEKKTEEIELLASISTKAEVRKLAEELGYDVKKLGI